MSKEPSLVILAAGMGSRYGGLKQMDPVDEAGRVIIDYSIHDAIEAGFKNIVFIIKHAIEEDFKEIIGRRTEKLANVTYVYQEVDTLPEGYEVPADRVKPWGTAHAIMQIAGKVDGPFAVINADDYYGKDGYRLLYRFLTEEVADDKYCMIGYVLENTVSDHGHVARGVCVTEDGYLKEIHERKQIEVHGDDIEFTLDGGTSWTKLDRQSVVSMNMWGFPNTLIQELETRFRAFLNAELERDPLKCEYLLPEVVEECLKAGTAKVKVFTSKDKWYGVTYKEDKEGVVKALKTLREDGLYPNFR